MYLKKIVYENMGPIFSIDIEPGFNKNGDPKPLIIVGKNGTGKSILISNIVDSFFEFGDQAYSDVTNKVNMGHSYFKVLSDSQIQFGQKSMVCFLKYSAGENEKETAEYLYHGGEFDFESFKSKYSNILTSISYNKEQGKNITNNKKLFNVEFRNNVIVYFPPERFAVPYWMGTSYSTSHDYGNVNLNENFTHILNKPIIADNTTQENTKWLIDVIVDSKATLTPANGGYQIKNSDGIAYEAFQEGKKNVENIISKIIEDEVSIEFGWRGRGKSRLIINSILGEKTIAPTFDAFSTGQMILLNMFLTIVRYANSTNIDTSINVQNIRGIVVVDEIELHLHSDLQRKVLPRLIKLFPKVQFIITSHSPLFLLGMREVFNDGGFDLYEMPYGKKIEAEDFSEFEHAYDAMTTTQAFRAKIRKAIQDRSLANEKALIITEGATDWKHMKRAWNKLKDDQEYVGLDGKFEFLEYEPVHNPATEALELQMGDCELVKTCESVAKLPQLRKMIFIADADHPETTKKLVEAGKAYKKWGTQVYSFQIPVPSHREGQKVCIEHYYTDKELKTEKNINGKKCRLFLGNEFDNRGISNDKKYVCSNRNECGPDKNSIIEGDTKSRVTLLEDESVNVALSKMKFADAVLAEEEAFAYLDSKSFKGIFDIIKQIIVPAAAVENVSAPPTIEGTSFP